MSVFAGNEEADIYVGLSDISEVYKGDEAVIETDVEQTDYTLHPEIHFYTLSGEDFAADSSQLPTDFTCSLLYKISVPNTATSIITSIVTYGNGMSSIPDNFANGNRYYSSELSGTLPMLRSISCGDVLSVGSYAFMNCGNSLCAVILPSATYIGDNAFYKCSCYFDMPNIEYIGDSAFFQSRLCGINANGTPHLDFYLNNIKTIGDNAFCNVKGTWNYLFIHIGESISSIGSLAFSTDSWTYVYFKGKTLDEVKAMDNYPWGCLCIYVE